MQLITSIQAVEQLRRRWAQRRCLRLALEDVAPHTRSICINKGCCASKRWHWCDCTCVRADSVPALVARWTRRIRRGRSTRKGMPTVRWIPLNHWFHLDWPLRRQSLGSDIILGSYWDYSRVSCGVLQNCHQLPRSYALGDPVYHYFKLLGFQSLGRYPYFFSHTRIVDLFTDRLKLGGLDKVLFCREEACRQSTHFLGVFQYV